MIFYLFIFPNYKKKKKISFLSLYLLKKISCENPFFFFFQEVDSAHGHILRISSPLASHKGIPLSSNNML